MPLKDLEGMQLTFKKSALAALNDGEQKIIFVFAAISNRLKLLETHSFSHWATAKDESRSEPVRSAALCGVVESLILLAGELKEGWESIQQCYYSTQVSKKLNPALPAGVQSALKRCGRHFEGTGLVSYLRNNFANHNDAEQMLLIPKALDDEAEFVFSLFPHDNKYFEYATKVRLMAIAHHLKLPDREWDKVIDRMVVIVVKEVYADVHEALNGILSQIFTAVELERDPVVAADVRTWNEFPGEFFFYINHLKS